MFNFKLLATCSSPATRHVRKYISHRDDNGLSVYSSSRCHNIVQCDVFSYSYCKRVIPKVGLHKILVVLACVFWMASRNYAPCILIFLFHQLVVMIPSGRDFVMLITKELCQLHNNFYTKLTRELLIPVLATRR